jgi:surface protein
MKSIYAITLTALLLFTGCGGGGEDYTPNDYTEVTFIRQAPSEVSVIKNFIPEAEQTEQIETSIVKGVNSEYFKITNRVDLTLVKSLKDVTVDKIIVKVQIRYTKDYTKFLEIEVNLLNTVFNNVQNQSIEVNNGIWVDEDIYTIPDFNTGTYKNIQLLNYEDKFEIIEDKIVYIGGGLEEQEYVLNLEYTLDSGETINDFLVIEIDTTFISRIIPILNDTKLSISENSVPGTSLGNVIVETKGDSKITSYTLSGTDKNFFNINNITGEITSNISFDYEEKDLYVADILATNDAGDSAVKSLIVNIIDIKDVVPSLNNTTLTIIENSVIGTELGNINILTKGDSEITSYTLLGIDKSLFSISTSGLLTSATSFDYETKNKFDLTVLATNDTGDSAEVTLIINIIDMDDNAPVLNNTTLNINENTENGVIIGTITLQSSGSPITAYTLSGTDSGLFHINNNGLLTVDGAYDYEALNIYFINVTATNIYGISNPVVVTIHINDVNDNPPTLGVTTLSAVENEAIGVILGSVQVDDIGGDDLSGYILSGANSDLFSVDNTGVVTAESTYDYETVNSYTIQVIGTNKFGDSPIANIIINIIDVNDNPPTLGTTLINTEENQAIGISIGNLVVADIGGSPITSYAISGTDASKFTINEFGLIIANDTYDYETKPSYTIQATATNSFGVSPTKDITIDIRDVNDNPPTLTITNLNIDENSGSGSTIGNVVVSDMGGDMISSYTLSGTDASKFTINNSGIVSTNASFDYETKATYTIQVKATNNFGDSPNVNLNIDINDIPDIKPILANTTLSVDENATVNSTIGSLSVLTNTGDSPVTNFTLYGADSTYFKISSTGVILVNGTYDYEIKSIYNFEVTGTNGAGESAKAGVIVNINNISDIKPVLLSTNVNVLENQASNLNIGSMNISTPGDSPITLYTLSGTGSTLFTVNSSGQIYTLSTYDFETKNSYLLTVVATNGAGNSLGVSLSITIDDQWPEDGDICNDGDNSTFDDHYTSGVCAGTKFPVCPASKYADGDTLVFNTQTYRVVTNSTIAASANYSAICTTQVTSMKSLFKDNTTFNGNINNFDTSNVTDMSYMFNNASSFNQPLTNFNTNKVTTMSFMFHTATAFNQSVNNFNTSNVTNMYAMFYSAIYFNQSISNFDTAKVTNMAYMFSGKSGSNTVFNQPIGNFNTSNVTNMYAMFAFNTGFNQSLSNFNTSNVTNMSSMFYLSNFNNTINNFNMSSITDMTNMFKDNSNFNQDLSSWNVKTGALIIDYDLNATSWSAARPNFL